MNTCKRADDDGEAREAARFEGSVFVGGAFAVVGDDPFYAFVEVVCGYIRL